MPEQEKNPTQEMFPGIYTAASLIVAGRKIVLESLREPPFFPDIEELADRMWQESGIDYWSVPPLQKVIIAERSKVITPLLFKRAELQQKYSIAPTLVKQKIISIINEQLEGDLRLNADSINIVWGMFSFGLEVDREQFQGLVKYHFPLDKDALPRGYVTGQFMGELGPIPIIQKGKDKNLTLLHEDLHVLQANLGYLRGPDVEYMSANPEFLRVLEGKDIHEGDLEIAQDFLIAVVNSADADIFIELQTSLWEGNQPGSNIMDGYSFGYVDAALGAFLNVVHDPYSILTDQEKIEKTFNAERSINEINEKRALLSMYAHKAMVNYNGPLKREHFVAALTLVIPPNTPIEIIKAIMLGGRHKELEVPLKRTIYVDLAGAISTFARRKINPNGWGSGDPLRTPEEIDRFIQIVSNVFNSRNLIEGIIENNNITPGELEKTKLKLAQYGKMSAPAGLRGKVERMLKEALV